MALVLAFRLLLDHAAENTSYAWSAFNVNKSGTVQGPIMEAAYEPTAPSSLQASRGARQYAAKLSFAT